MSNCANFSEIKNLTNFQFLKTLRCHYTEMYNWLFVNKRDFENIDLNNNIFSTCDK